MPKRRKKNRVKNFTESVYQLVRKTPGGKVVTYGQVGEALGSRRLARVVGNALHQNPYPSVPCHRVVNYQGRLAMRFGRGGWQQQKQFLLKEGVSFKSEKRVDLSKHRARIK